MAVRFTLRDLFLTTTLIAVGVGGMVWAFRNPEREPILLGIIGIWSAVSE